MKKKITKPTPSPTPATKTVAVKPVAKMKPAAPAAVKTAVAVPAPAVPTPKPVAVPAPVAAKPVPVKPVAPKPVVTTISAHVDIGFGNTLYMRGEGNGLSWNAGVAMQCVADDLWQIKLGASPGGHIFKFLVNDLTWNVGPDHKIASGAAITIKPEF